MLLQGPRPQVNGTLATPGKLQEEIWSIIRRVFRRSIMSAAKPVVTRSPDILGGTPVFRGTRVPVKTLIDYLEAGDSLEVFLKDFPTVSREQTVAALQIAKEALLQDAGAA